jgi:Mor family transcriptional regulator
MTNFLSEMREFLARELKVHSIESKIADNISSSVVIKFRQNYGGMPIYIHKSNDNSERNVQIYREFNGKNMRHICHKYDLCYQQVCKIIRNERKKRQGDLFA